MLRITADSRRTQARLITKYDAASVQRVAPPPIIRFAVCELNQASAPCYAAHFAVGASARPPLSRHARRVSALPEAVDSQARALLLDHADRLIMADGQDHKAELRMWAEMRVRLEHAEVQRAASRRQCLACVLAPSGQ